MSIDKTTCVVCGRAYVRASKPVWMADKAGRIVGSAHTGCSWPADRSLRFVSFGTTPLEAVQFKAWHDAKPERDHQMVILIGTGAPQETPSPDQKHLLNYWETHGRPALGVDAETAWTRYRALCAEYAAWRAANPE